MHLKDSSLFFLAHMSYDTKQLVVVLLTVMLDENRFEGLMLRTYELATDNYCRKSWEKKKSW